MFISFWSLIQFMPLSSYLSVYCILCCDLRRIFRGPRSADLLLRTASPPDGGNLMSDVMQASCGAV